MAVGITSYTCATVSSVSTVPKNKTRFRSVTDYEGKFIKRLYHADNLDVLNFLVKDDDVCGKVNLIYIDPPYNTVVLLRPKISSMPTMTISRQRVIWIS